MQIIPVLDIKQGQVVHAIGGRRSEYRPIRSKLTNSTDPVQVALAMRDAVCAEDIYIADLDAIEGAEPDWRTIDPIRVVVGDQRDLWIDAGAKTFDHAWDVGTHGRAVLALESLDEPMIVEDLDAFGFSERLIFSLDLRAGRMLGDLSRWHVPADMPTLLVEQLVRMGLQSVIVLDLAHVGMEKGTGTEPLCQAIKKTYPEMSVYTGGGIRTRDDAKRLEDIGVDGVLIASALHNGTW